MRRSAVAPRRLHAPAKRATRRAYTTREAWLAALAELLRPHFARHKAALPKRVRFSCGWPSHRVERVIGQCWAPEAAADGVTQIFVSPMIDTPLVVASTLVHELVHAAVGNGAGHGPKFARVAKRLGLVGHMTETVAGPELVEVLAPLMASLGPWPNGALRLPGRRTIATPTPADPSEPRISDKPKKQAARMLKLECPACGYTVRTTAKWIAVGLPLCPSDRLELAPDGADVEQEAA